MFVTHGKPVQKLARQHGWLPGARYTNLRDVRGMGEVGFIDIDWQRYDFTRHLDVVKAVRPKLTIARDLEDIKQLKKTVDQAYALLEFCQTVAIVPKDPRLASRLERVIPNDFMLAYSVPTKYGGTRIPPAAFKRPVHLLGGRPDVQRRMADSMNVVSVDVNRFTLDATFGDYFDGARFRPHPIGGYVRCLRDSIRNISKLWLDYRPKRKSSHGQ